MNIISYIELTYRTVLYIYPPILLDMVLLDQRIYVFNFDKLLSVFQNSWVDLHLY